MLRQNTWETLDLTDPDPNYDPSYSQVLKGTADDIINAARRA